VWPRLQKLGEDRQEGHRRPGAHDESPRQEHGEARGHTTGEGPCDQGCQPQFDGGARASARSQSGCRVAGGKAPDRVHGINQAHLDGRKRPLVGEEREQRRDYPDGERRQDIQSEQRTQGTGALEPAPGVQRSLSTTVGPLS